MKTALITGSHGFIGTHLVRKLTQEGMRVVALAHKTLQNPYRLKVFLSQHPTDYIFHLAAYGNMAQQRDAQEIFHANLSATFHLLEATLDAPYTQFVYVSTSSVTLAHQTLYSATKHGAEDLCHAYRDEYNKPITIVRPYSVYGAGEALYRFIPTVFQSCLKGYEFTLDPSPVHDWVYIDDVIGEIIRPIHQKTDFVIHAGTGVGTTNREVVHMIEKITKRDAIYKTTHNMRRFDTIDWVAPVFHPEYFRLQEGLQKYYESIK